MYGLDAMKKLMELIVVLIDNKTITVEQAKEMGFTFEDKKENLATN